MAKKTKYWNKCKGHHYLYCGHPQEEDAVAEVSRSKEWKIILVRFHSNPKTGKPWKSMAEARKWVEKATKEN